MAGVAQRTELPSEVETVVVAPAPLDAECGCTSYFQAKRQTVAGNLLAPAKAASFGSQALS
jgi:hypothetical protein